MTDIADTALQRMTCDLRTAVPNIVPLSGGYLEFLPTKAGGRYRANSIGSLGLCAAAGDELSFTAADSCFEMTSPAISFTAGDSIIIGIKQADGSAPYNSNSTVVLRAHIQVQSVCKAKLSSARHNLPHLPVYPVNVLLWCRAVNNWSLTPVKMSAAR